MEEQQLQVETETSSKKVWIIAAAVVVVFAGAAAVYFFRTKEVPQIPATLSIEASLPKTGVNATGVFPDPDDKNILWLEDWGAVLKYNLENNKIERVFSAKDGVSDPLFSALRKGDNLYLGFNGGIKRISLQTGASKVFTVQDGLVNGGNINLFDDPADPDTIWIGTFDGLSKFSVSTERFTNFRESTGVPGSSWTVNGNVVVGKQYLWTIFVASAYGRGAIARYDKQQGIWKSWGPEAFGLTERVDFDGFDADGENAVATLSGDIFRYNPATDKWDRLVDESQADSKQFLVLFPDKVWYVQDRGFRSLDLSTRAVTNVPGVADAYGGYFDRAHGRVFFRDGKSELWVLDVGSMQAHALAMPWPAELRIDEVVATTEKGAILSGDNGLFVYDFATKQIRRMEGMSEANLAELSFSAKEEDGHIMILGQELGMGVSRQQIFTVDRDTLRLLEFDPEPTPEQIEAIADADNTVLESKVFAGSLFSARLGNEGGRRQLGDEVHFEIQKVGEQTWTKKTLPVAAAPYNPFGNPPAVEVYDMAISSGNPNFLWIGTDRGLAIYDLATDRGRVFTTADGLASNEVDKIFAEEQLVLQHPTGVYIYSY